MSTILTIQHTGGSLAARSQRIALQEGQILRLGRAPESDIKFSDTQDDSVSSLHAELSFQAGRLFVEDKRSSNGTYVDGTPCQPFQKVAVPDGATLRLAKAGPEMRFTLASAPSAAVAPPKESVGRATMLREIDRARQEEHQVVVGEMSQAQAGLGRRVGLGLALVLLLAAGGIGGATWWNHRQVQQGEATLHSEVARQQQALTAEKTRWADIEQRVSQAVVLVRCRYRLRSAVPVDAQTSLAVERPQDGGDCKGTGVLIGPGLVLTARHVAQPWSFELPDWQDVKPEYDFLEVQFPGKQPINATVGAVYGEHDLLLLQVPATSATPIQLGRSNADIQVTDSIAVIGYPGELGQYSFTRRDVGQGDARLTEVTTVVPTFVTGTVSQSLNVTGTDATADFLHFNAALEPGNSGGPVLNDEGQLIGIVSWPFERTEKSIVRGGRRTAIFIHQPMPAGSRAVPIDDIDRFLKERGLH